MMILLTMILKSSVILQTTLHATSEFHHPENIVVKMDTQ